MSKPRSEMVIRPRTKDLLFCAYDRPIHPELFDTLELRCFETRLFRLRLRLTPAGHFLEWGHDKTILVEALAEQSAMIPEYRQLFAHRLGGERAEHHQPTASVRYETCFQVERLPQELFLAACDEIRRGADKEGVLRMLRANDRLGLAPMSYLDLQTRAGSLVVHAYHTFPDECAILKTQSLIELARR